MFGRRERLETKAPHELRMMRRAGLVVARALEAVSSAAQPGVTTLRLDEVARETILAAGARPSFPEVPSYRHTLCVSVNEAVVHGIPDPHRTLAEGDNISIDCGAVLAGWHSDSAVTVTVAADGAGGASPQPAMTSSIAAPSRPTRDPTAKLIEPVSSAGRRADQARGAPERYNRRPWRRPIAGLGENPGQPSAALLGVRRA